MEVMLEKCSYRSIMQSRYNEYHQIFPLIWKMQRKTRSPTAAYGIHKLPGDGAIKAGVFKIKISFYKSKFDEHKVENIFSKNISNIITYSFLQRRIQHNKRAISSLTHLLSGDTVFIIIVLFCFKTTSVSNYTVISSFPINKSSRHHSFLVFHRFALKARTVQGIHLWNQRHSQCCQKLRKIRIHDSSGSSLPFA